MPTSMNPSTALIRSRWNSGITTAAAPSTTNATRIPSVATPLPAAMPPPNHPCNTWQGQRDGDKVIRPAREGADPPA